MSPKCSAFEIKKLEKISGSLGPNGHLIDKFQALREKKELYKISFLKRDFVTDEIQSIVNRYHHVNILPADSEIIDEGLGLENFELIERKTKIVDIFIRQSRNRDYLPTFRDMYHDWITPVPFVITIGDDEDLDIDFDF